MKLHLPLLLAPFAATAFTPSCPTPKARPLAIRRSTSLNNYSTVKWSPSGGGTPFAAPSSYSSADLDEVRAELKSLMDNPSWGENSSSRLVCCLVDRTALFIL